MKPSFMNLISEIYTLVLPLETSRNPLCKSSYRASKVFGKHLNIGLMVY